MTPSPSTPIARRVAGFTLLELVLAIAITAVVLIGAQSAVLIAARAVPDGKGKNDAAMTAAAALRMLSEDLACALEVNSAEADAIEFTVPDRTGDGEPEQIRYEWCEVDRTEFCREFNGTWTTLATGVKGFTLDYETEQVADPVSYIEGVEQVVFSYSGVLTTGDSTVTVTDWIGQAFRPSLPNGTQLWRATRAQLRMKVNGIAVGESRVQLRTMSGSSPSGRVVAEQPVPENDLRNFYTNVGITLDAPGLSPSDSFCIVVKGVGGQTACDVEYQSLLSLLSSASVVATTNAGASWTTNTLRALPMTVWGKPGSLAPTSYTQHLRVVRAALTAGPGSGVRADIAVRTVNGPSVVVKAEDAAPAEAD